MNHDHKILDHASTLVDILRWRSAHQPDRLAYVFLKDGEVEESRYTYAELDRKAKTIAAHLMSQSKPGDQGFIAISGRTRIHRCLFWMPLRRHHRGSPPIPRAENRSLGRIEGIVRDADAHFTLTTSQIRSDIERSFAEDPVLAGMHIVSTDRLDEDAAEAWSEPTLSRDTLAFLQYTSGIDGNA